MRGGGPESDRPRRAAETFSGHVQRKQKVVADLIDAGVAARGMAGMAAAAVQAADDRHAVRRSVLPEGFTNDVARRTTTTKGVERSRIDITYRRDRSAFAGSADRATNAAGQWPLARRAYRVLVGPEGFETSTNGLRVA